jgi:hypothetical protein
LAKQIATSQRIENIAAHDATILSQAANPLRMEFSERTGVIDLQRKRGRTR